MHGHEYLTTRHTDLISEEVVLLRYARLRRVDKGTVLVQGGSSMLWVGQPCDDCL